MLTMPMLMVVEAKQHKFYPGVGTMFGGVDRCSTTA